MATFIVTNAADSGAGSLRDAIAQANASAGADTITFDAAVFNGEAADRIRLTSGTLVITEALTIDGGAAGVVITGDTNGDDVTAGGITDLAASRAAGALDDNRRILDAGYAVALTLSRVTLTGGYTTDLLEGGGAVRAGTLTVTDSTLAGNGTGGSLAPGGAAFVTGNAAFTNVTIAGNATLGNFGIGGGAYAGGDLTITNGTVTGNEAASALTRGGGLATIGSLTVTNSIVLGNASGAAGTAGDEVSGGTALVLTGGNIIGKGGGAADVFSGATDVGDTTASAVFAATAAGPGGGVAGVLADNGGPVETVALRAGVNPAIDGGSGGTVAADARGVAAAEVPALGASGSGAAVRDLGAFEVTTPAEAQSLVVTTAADVVDAFDGLTSLREAVAYANTRGGADTVTFDQAVFNGEAADIIRLTGGTIRITDSLRIDGGPNGVLITGDRNGDDVTYAGGVTDVAASLAGEDRLDDNVRVFDALFVNEVTLQRLTITGGRTTEFGEFGGGVRGSFDLQVIDSTIAGNSTTGDFARGGGVSAQFLRLTNATLVGNTTTGDAAAGGAAYAQVVYAVNSTVTGNSTAGVGVFQEVAPFDGGVWGYSYTAGAGGGGLFGLDVFLTNSIVAGNMTTGSGVPHEDIGFYRSADVLISDGDRFAGAVKFIPSPLSGSLEWSRSLVGLRDGAVLGGGVNGIALGDEFSMARVYKGAVISLQEIFAQTTTLSDGTVAGVLADNGGPVPTVALLVSNANPAIDRSDARFTTADARGIPESEVNGVGPDGRTPRDLGAFEVEVPQIDPLLVTTVADVVDGFDGVTSLREAVIYANSRPGDDTITFDPTIFDGSPAAILRLTQGAIEIERFDRDTRLTIDGGPAGVTITGDRLGNDITDAMGITDVLASRAGTNRLSDNSRLFAFDYSSALAGTWDTRLTLKNFTLTGGYATSGIDLKDSNANGGGALATQDLTLIDTLVKGNATRGVTGGAIASADVTLLRSTVTDNHVFDGGAGAVNSGGGLSTGKVTLIDSIVSNNTVQAPNARGGGIVTNEFVIENSTISGNHTIGTSARAGGMYSIFSSGSIVNSTITGNSTTGLGGGISYRAGEPFSITNSIILGNESTGAGVGSDNLENRGSVAPTLLGNNIIGTDTGTANIFHGATDIGDTTAAEVFATTLVLAGGTVAGVAADNGDPTHTVALNPDPANPALGGADPATATDTDQRGITRDATPDLGAFEATKPVAVADSLGTGREMGIFFDALANDTAAAGGIDVTTLRFVGADAGSDGRTLTVAGVGLWEAAPDVGFVTFTPAAGFQGIASVRYVVADLFGGVSDPAEIRVDVAPGASGTATAGNDRLFGSIYGDSMDGLGGNDSIRGLDGFDILKGGDGNDSIDAGLNFDSVDGGAGDDVILVRGLAARDDIILGGDGFDTVRVVPGAATVIFSRMQWDGVEAFDGSGAALIGTTAGDLLDLSRFASVTGVAAMRGGFGDDTLTGAGDGDSIAGGAGDDEITGGAGNDTMAGGGGFDRFVFGPGFGQDVILGFDANPAGGGQDLLVLQGYATPPEVLFEVIGGDTRVTIGTDSVLLVGVTGIGAKAASMADVVIVPDVVLE